MEHLLMHQNAASQAAAAQAQADAEAAASAAAASALALPTTGGFDWGDFAQLGGFGQLGDLRNSVGLLTAPNAALSNSAMFPGLSMPAAAKSVILAHPPVVVYQSIWDSRGTQERGTLRIDIQLSPQMGAALKAMGTQGRWPSSERLATACSGHIRRFDGQELMIWPGELQEGETHLEPMKPLHLPQGIFTFSLLHGAPTSSSSSSSSALAFDGSAAPGGYILSVAIQRKHLPVSRNFGNAPLLFLFVLNPTPTPSADKQASQAVMPAHTVAPEVISTTPFVTLSKESKAKGEAAAVEDAERAQQAARGVAVGPKTAGRRGKGFARRAVASIPTQTDLLISQHFREKAEQEEREIQAEEMQLRAKGIDPSKLAINGNSSGNNRSKSAAGARPTKAAAAAGAAGGKRSRPSDASSSSSSSSTSNGTGGAKGVRASQRAGRGAGGQNGSEGYDDGDDDNDNDNSNNSAVPDPLAAAASEAAAMAAAAAIAASGIGANSGLLDLIMTGNASNALLGGAPQAVASMMAGDGGLLTAAASASTAPNSNGIAAATSHNGSGNGTRPPSKRPRKGRGYGNSNDDDEADGPHYASSSSSSSSSKASAARPASSFAAGNGISSSSSSNGGMSLADQAALMMSQHQQAQHSNAAHASVGGFMGDSSAYDGLVMPPVQFDEATLNELLAMQQQHQQQQLQLQQQQQAQQQQFSLMPAPPASHQVNQGQASNGGVMAVAATDTAGASQRPAVAMPGNGSAAAGPATAPQSSGRGGIGPHNAFTLLADVAAADNTANGQQTGLTPSASAGTAMAAAAAALQGLPPMLMPPHGQPIPGLPPGLEAEQQAQLAMLIQQAAAAAASAGPADPSQWLMQAPGPLQ